MSGHPPAGGATHPLRFGVWALINGTWASLHHPDDPPDASYLRNRRQIVEAEALGYDTTLVAQHTINPWSDELDGLEAWTASAALAEATERIEIITAIKPFLYHPVVLAKQALQIEEISQGRFAINLVNAWYKPEIEKAGLPFLEHDERYAYGREWLTVARSLLEGRRTTFHGRHFDVDGYLLRPEDRFRDRPRIYLGGESEPARALGADLADLYFINGQPIERVRAIVADVASRGRAGQPPLRFGLSAFVIARETEAQAREALAFAWEIAARDEPKVAEMLKHIDTKAVMFQTHAQFPAIGTNGGTAAGLVGTYDQVAERIRDFHAEGIETFMLQFQPFEPEMRRFAEEVIPRVRRLVPSAGGGWAVAP
ncbi:MULTISPECIES: LLM class flavin-dependent oxidoreductase [Pseudofrankia]|uniref:LLM class flavin-dependent oxidoreductase n=1 Tax=Pseudofrankia TaxID=2994363 RepID=UPI000234D30A|nr:MULTISPECIES: LLM class flavin-dependent oxidoreductase [Pseudofrankia]OHV33888.1 alkanesulfonate monooxygenase [Pseudofrankia sp. EUN1h]